MKINSCRLCSGSLNKTVLNLGRTPLANEFFKEKRNQETFPLEICKCGECGHFQLNEQIDPERMFRNYLYGAGHSDANIAHFRRYAFDMVQRFHLQKGDSILDIGSNDGTFLKQFSGLGLYVIGVDPAINLVDKAEEAGIPTMPEFFSFQMAKQLLHHCGQFDLITCNNCFAHSPDLQDIARGVKILLKKNGIFVLEVSYFLDVCMRNLFDTIYHEHTSYWTIGPMQTFFNKFNLVLFDVQHISNHGGSIRCFIRHKGADLVHIGGNMLKEKMAEDNIDVKVSRFRDTIIKLSSDLDNQLRKIKKQNKSIAIYGVPAKATTFIHSLALDEKLFDYAVDDYKPKQGCFIPGTNIKIFNADQLKINKPDVLLILAWNFADNIIRKLGTNYEYIVPLGK